MRLLTLLMLLLPAMAMAEPERFDVAGGTYLLDWRGEFTAADQDKLRRWLRYMDGTVSLLHGSWPRDPIRIAFQPWQRESAWATGPLPFARILRNEPEGILFYVNPDNELQAFIDDWTAYHEFTHLFIPYPGRADIWFSEGLASYYQNILQLRAGVLTAAQVRQRFAAAFARGANDDEHDDLTLGELSSAMIERRAFQRIYWSGALYFLEADLALRSLEQPTSLDAVLRDYGACCLRQGEEQRGRDIAAALDNIAGAEVFTPLYARYEASRAIPPYAELLARVDFATLATAPRR